MVGTVGGVFELGRGNGLRVLDEVAAVGRVEYIYGIWGTPVLSIARSQKKKCMQHNLTREFSNCKMGYF